MADDPRIEAGETLAAALDRFFYDLRYTAPEMLGDRFNQLGARITPAMSVFGYPREGENADG